MSFEVWNNSPAQKISGCSSSVRVKTVEPLLCVVNITNFVAIKFLNVDYSFCSSHIPQYKSATQEKFYSNSKAGTKKTFFYFSSFRTNSIVPCVTHLYFITFISSYNTYSLLYFAAQLSMLNSFLYNALPFSASCFNCCGCAFNHSFKAARNVS